MLKHEKEKIQINELQFMGNDFQQIVQIFGFGLI